MGISSDQLSYQVLYDIMYKIMERELENKREFICYAGDGKGNLVPIEQTERFNKMLEEMVNKYPQLNGFNDGQHRSLGIGGEEPFWDENSREIL